MADQDFNIKVVTTADTTGIRQTSSELDKLKQQQATFAETARRQAATAAAAAKPATVIAPTESAGLTGTAAGIGTIVLLLTSAWRQIKEFSDEQNKWVAGMIEAAEKSRALGLAVADMLDAMKSAERIDTEPLQVSFDRLKQKVIQLKTEMNIAFGLGEYEDVKRIAAALGVVESQVHRVTAALSQQAAEKEKARAKEARAQESFIKGAVETTGPQVQAALRNEEAARRAAASGDERSAEQFRKTSEQIQRGMTSGQSEEFNQLKAEMARMNVSLQLILETFR